MTRPLHGRRLAWVMLSLMLGGFLAALQQAVLATALPTVVTELDTGAHLPWVVTAYLLCQTVSTPIWGKLGDLRGRKGVFLASVAVFLVGSVLGATAQDLTQLILWRALQGLGGGGILVNARALIADVVEFRRRARHLAVFSTVFSVSSVLGPLLGGLIVEVAGWRWIFLATAPLAVLALVAAAIGLPRDAGTPGRRLDLGGSLLLVVATSGAVVLITFAGSAFPWWSWQTLGLGVGVIGGTVLFVLVERRVAEPVVPLRLFRVRQFRLASVLTLTAGVGMLGVGTFVPTYYQVAQGLGPTASGLLQLPQNAGMLVAGLVTAAVLTAGRSPRMLGAASAALLALGLLALASLDQHSPLWLCAAALLVFGLGLGVVMQFGLVLGQAAAPRSDIGVATAVSTFARSMGMSLGTAALGAVFTAVVSQALLGVPGLTDPAGLGPVELGSLPAAARSAVIAGYVEGIQAVFLAATPLALVVLAASLLLHPMREGGEEGSG